MVSVSEIIKFIKHETLIEMREDSDIWRRGTVGDDFAELMEAYAKQFGVEMNGYRWYFHHEDEGWNLGGLFFKPPNRRVKRIPVTPKMLASFANQGRWSIDYPEHHIPKKRVDILFNQLCAGAILLLMIWFLISKYGQ